MSTYFDGSYSTATQHGALVPWTDNDSRSLLYTQTLHRSVATWEPLTIGTKGTGTTLSKCYLVEETPPRDIGSGLLEWTRVWAQMPKTRVEPEDYVFNVQAIESGALVELPYLVNSSVVYEFYRTTDPARIPLLKTFRWAQAGASIYGTGTPFVAGADFIIAENSSLARWRGNIFVRKTRYVRPASLTIV